MKKLMVISQSLAKTHWTAVYKHWTARRIEDGIWIALSQIKHFLENWTRHRKHFLLLECLILKFSGRMNHRVFLWSCMEGRNNHLSLCVGRRGIGFPMKYIYRERKPVLQWDDLFSSCSIIVFIFCNGFFQIALKNSPGIRQCICFGPQRVECEKGVTNRVNALLMNHPAAVLKDCLKMPIHLEDTWKKNTWEIISILSVVFRAMILQLDLFIAPVTPP